MKVEMVSNRHEMLSHRYEMQNRKLNEIVDKQATQIAGRGAKCPC